MQLWMSNAQAFEEPFEGRFVRRGDFSLQLSFDFLSDVRIQLNDAHGASIETPVRLRSVFLGVFGADHSCKGDKRSGICDQQDGVKDTSLRSFHWMKAELYPSERTHA